MATAVTPLQWPEAQAALADMVGRVTEMMRRVTDPTVAALGHWTLAEVAMHLSQAWQVVPALAGTGSAGDALLGDVWDLGAVTNQGVASDPERNLGVLADRIDERAAGFFAVSAGRSADEPRPWLVTGSTVPRFVLTCHLLNEMIMHGYDMATAAGIPWKIDRPYAAMALRGFIVEIIKAVDPRALVDQERAAGFHARYDVRLRGAQRCTFVFDDGALHIEEPSERPVDCHISADPAALLLVTWGRKSQWPAIAQGQLTAWGRKPWLGPRFRSLLRNP